MYQAANLLTFKELTHGFFTRDEGCPAHAVVLKQVHGTKVAAIDKTNRDQAVEADAAVTSLSGIRLTVKTADCAPILFYNRITHQIAVTHAGWRGALFGVIKNTVAALGDPADICAALGPCIHAENYEVKSDMMDKFADKSRFKRLDDGSWRFDLPGFVADRIKEAGVPNFTDLALDTFANPALASYRFNSQKGLPTRQYIYAAIMMK